MFLLSNARRRHPILGNPGATSREDAIFPDERLVQELESGSPTLEVNIASSRLVAPGFPRMPSSMCEMSNSL